jgi:hypothetical protein
MLPGWTLLVIAYLVPCAILLGRAILKTCEGRDDAQPDELSRELYLVIISSKFYLCWFCPWLILWVIYFVTLRKLVLAKRGRNRAQVVQWNRNVV